MTPRSQLTAVPQDYRTGSGTFSHKARDEPMSREGSIPGGCALARSKRVPGLVVNCSASDRVGRFESCVVYRIGGEVVVQVLTCGASA